MKKKALVAAVLAATTFSATTAFAASNPFNDVPADHWSYDAIEMLAKDGVIEGYGDGTFQGDKLMNRYEMAEIVAKAAEKYGTVDLKDKGVINKLEREYAQELKDMEVRLTAVESDVADLKKGMSSFKWYGDARLRYIQNKDNKMTDKNSANGKERQWEKRVRLGIYGEPAKNLSVDARLKYEDKTGVHDGWGSNNRNQNTWDNTWNDQSSFRLDKASLIWNNKGTRIAAGRNEVSLGQGGLWWENPIDGVTISHQFGPKLTAMAGYGDLAAEGWHDTTMWTWFTGLNYQASPATQITFGSMHTNSELQHPQTSNTSNYYYYDSNGTEHQTWNTYRNTEAPYIVGTGGKITENTKNPNKIPVGTLVTWDSTLNSGKGGPAAVFADGVKESTSWEHRDYKLNQFAVGVNTQLAPKWNLIAEGLYNNIADKDSNGNKLDRKGFWTRLTYGKQDWSKAGTWKVYGEYFALGNASIDSKFWGHRLNIAGGNSNWGDGNTWGDGDRGWGLGASMMLAANTNLELTYYKMKPYSGSATFDDYQDMGYAALTYSF